MEFPYHAVGYYEGGKPIGPACWSHHDVIFLPEGRLRIRAGRRGVVLEEGGALVIPPDNPFEGELLNPRAVLWVLHYRPGPEDRSRFFQRRTPFLVPAACRSTRMRHLMDDFSETWLRETTPRHRPRSLQRLGETILARLEETWLNPPRQESPRLKAAAAAARHGASVAEMARAAGLGPSRFRETFREEYGQSPAAYRFHQQMEEAQRRLTTTSQPIKEISQQVGYRELAAFHRAFRKATGMPPALYRKRFGAGVV